MKRKLSIILDRTSRHAVRDADGAILKKNRTNLDTFAWYTGRLVIGVFDDDTPGGPLEILEVRGQTGVASSAP
jgi:hypothetical protein